jgi:tRNA A-37 threonylcarbamoyl transferase component Bud32
MSNPTRAGSALDDALQQSLLPDLEIVRPLGSGASANVYLAREPALQRLVAVKILKPEFAADSVVRQRFEREAQSAARITHAHVTSIYRIGRLDGDVPYMVMEYVEGRTVADALAARGPMSVAEARVLIASIASALAAVHARGIVHRDVHTGNVFIEKDTERAVLGDFGIAAFVDSGAGSGARLTAVGERLGVTRSMSPEQVRGETVTEQSDVYALGVFAYEILTGRGPYDAKNDAELLVAHLKGTPRPMRELRNAVDERTASLIERCLAKDPRHRPLAREIAVELSGPVGAASDAPVVADGAVAQFMGEFKRRRVSQVLIAYGTVAGVIIGFSDSIFQTFDLSPAAHRVLIILTLAGFPVALALSWVFDAGRGGIRRTREGTPQSSRARAIVWAALTLCVALVAAIAWLLLRRAG